MQRIALICAGKLFQSSNLNIFLAISFFEMCVLSDSFPCVEIVHLHQILRKYGTPKPNKNKYSKAGKEQHQGKVVSTKRPITKPPTKEKSVLNSVR